jgi:hypothetical protein
VKPTATLEVLDPERGAGVVRGVVAWAALAAGLGPLAADRAGRTLQAALAAAGGPVSVIVKVENGAATVELQRLGGWPPEIAALVADVGASAVSGDALRVRLAPPPLRSV